MDEVTHLPDSLQKLLKVTVGMEWPEGNEAGLRAMSQAWSTFSQQLDELDRELTTSAKQVSEAMDGDAAEAFRRQVGHRIPEALGQLQEQAEQFAEESKNAAADIQKTKIMVVSMLVVLAATIAELIASLFGSLLIPGVVAAARAGIGALLRELAAKVAESGIKDLGKMALTAGRSGESALAKQGAKNIGRAGLTLGTDAAKYGAGGAAFGGGMDLGIQGIQDAAGERDGIDWSSVEHSVVGGAVGGAAFGVGRSVGRGLSSANRSALDGMSEQQRALIRPGMHVFGTLGYAGMQVGGAVLSTPLINLATGQSTWSMAGAGALGAASRMGKSGSETGGGASAAEAATGEDVKKMLVSDGPSETAGAGDRGAEAEGRGDGGAPVSTTSGSARTGAGTGSLVGSEVQAGRSTPPPAYSFMAGGAPAGTSSLHVPDVSGTRSPQAPFSGDPVEHQAVGGAHGAVGTGFTSRAQGAPAADTAAPAHQAEAGGGANLSSFLGGRPAPSPAPSTTAGDSVEHGAAADGAPAVASEPAPHGTSESGPSAGAELPTQPEPDAAAPEPQAPTETAPTETAASPVPSEGGARPGALSGATDPGGPTRVPTQSSAMPRPSSAAPGATEVSGRPVTGSSGPTGEPQLRTTSGAPTRPDGSTSGIPDRSAGSTPAPRPSAASAAEPWSERPSTNPPGSARSPENAVPGTAKDTVDGQPQTPGRWDHVPDADGSSPRWVWTPAGPVRPAHSPSDGDGPRGVSRANFTDPAHANLYADQRFPGVSQVNAREFAENRPGHRTNCPNAMVQIANARRFPDRAVRGEFRAGPSEPITPRELLNRGVVREYRPARSYAEIESHVLGLPDGAQVPVFVVHEDGSGGHHLVAENRGGAVHYLDNSEGVVAAKWPARHLLYGAFPDGGELPAARKGFAEHGPSSGAEAARGGDGAPDVPGGAGPAGRGPEVAHEVEFERGAKELSPHQREGLNAFVDDLVHRARSARRAGEPLPDVTVTGRGNGSRLPWSGADAAQQTGQQRADAVRAAVRERLAERLDNRALPQSDLRSGDFRITARAADEGAERDPATPESRRTTRVALFPTGTRVTVGHAGHDAEPVPHVLHMNWFGDRKPLAGPLGEQIRTWQAKAKESGWQVHLWVDDRAQRHNAEFLAGLGPNVQVRNVREVLPPDGGRTTEIPPKAAEAFHYALGKGAYNLSSDVARYAVLHQRGGVYLDVDIAPGEVALPGGDVLMARDGIPFLAPEIRDEGQAGAARANLAAADPEHWADRTPTDQDVVDWQYRNGELTNNLIISPKGSSFLHRLLEQLPDVDRLRQQELDLRRNAAHLTGPHRVQRLLEQVLRDSGLRGRPAEEFRAGRAGVDQDLVHQWAHRVQWVTDESGDQLHDEHGTSPSGAVSDAGATDPREVPGGSHPGSADDGAFPDAAGRPEDDPGPSSTLTDFRSWSQEQPAYTPDDLGSSSRYGSVGQSPLGDVTAFVDAPPPSLYDAGLRGGPGASSEATMRHGQADRRGGAGPSGSDPGRRGAAANVPGRRGSAGTEHAAPLLRGTEDPRGRLYEFHPHHVVRAPLVDGRGREIGVTYNTEVVSVRDDRRWARTEHHRTLRTRPNEIPREALHRARPQDWSPAPDHADHSGARPGPIHVVAEGRIGGVLVGLARGSRLPDGSVLDETARVRVDGRTFALINRHCPIVRRIDAADTDPERSVRLGISAFAMDGTAFARIARHFAPMRRFADSEPERVQRLITRPESDEYVREMARHGFRRPIHAPAGFHDRFAAGGVSASHDLPWVSYAPTSRHHVRRVAEAGDERLPSYEDLHGPPPERRLDGDDPFSVGRALGHEGTNPEDAREPAPPYSQSLGEHDARRILGGPESPAGARSDYRSLRGTQPDRSGASNVRGWGGELPRADAGAQHPVLEGAVSLGSFANDAEADRVFAQHYGHVVGVNAGKFGRRAAGHVRNCFASLVATSRTLAEGRTVAARRGDRTAVADAEQHLGDRFRYSSLEEITEHMLRQDFGAQGAVFLQRRDGTGHYVLVHTRAQTDRHGRPLIDERHEPCRAAEFVDGHRGSYVDLRDVVSVAFMPIRTTGTAPLPESAADRPEHGPELQGRLGGGHGPSRVAEEHELSRSVLDRLERPADVSSEELSPGGAHEHPLDVPGGAPPEPPRRPESPVDGQHDPAALVRRARSEGAEIVGTLDGQRIRAAIDGLADSAGPELRELVQHAFSDRNLTEQLSPRARDGAYAVDFTAGGSGSSPRIAVEMTGLRRRGDHVAGTADFGRSRERAAEVSTSASQRAQVGSDSFSTRLPTPIGVFMAKIPGLVDRSEGGLSVTREHEAATNVAEREVPATTGDYDATYRITVSEPGRHPWSRSTTRTDYVDARVPLAWPRGTADSGPVGEHRLDFRAHDLEAVEDLAFSGLGEVTDAVSRRLGLGQHEERELRAWLDRLGSDVRRGRDVFTDGAHETFRFRGRATKLRIFGRRPNTRVRVFVADGARVRALPRVDGEIQHRESTRTAVTAAQAKTRRRGFGAGMLFGDFTGTTAAAAGPVVEERGSTRNASEVTDEHERETVETYTGRLAKHRAEVTFLVEVGEAHRQAEARPFVRFDPVARAHVLTRVRRYEPKNLIKVDGGVTMWMKPHRADALGWSRAGAGRGDAADPRGSTLPDSRRAGGIGGQGGAVARTDPANDPAGASRHDVPDRNDAHFRIPRQTAEACTGAVLHELAVRGHVPPRELPALKKRFLEFLSAQENAREITNGGDGALFELSALVPKAPDVFLAADVDRGRAEHLGAPEERFSGAIRSAHRNAVEITKGRESSRGVAAYGVDGHEYPVGQATYETGTEHAQRVGQQVGHEVLFAADQRPHSYRYPMALRARIGGSLVRDSGPDVTVLPPIGGSVEVTASELPGMRAPASDRPSSERDTGGAGRSAERSGASRYAANRWYDGEPPPDAGAFTAPTGAEAASHKPIPHHVRTAADMLGGERPRGWRRWAGWPLKPLVGAEPPRFHENRGSRPSRNPALPGLTSFGSRAAREAGAGLAGSFRDSRRLLSHNRGGLLGSRDASGRVELATTTSNPRVVSGPVEHTFTTTVHAQTDPGTGTRKTRGGEVSGSTMQLEPFSNWLFFGNRPVIDLAARLFRTEGTTTDDVSRTTTTTRHTERSYVLRTDETHVMRTSRRHNWQDSFAAHHDGHERTAVKWIRVPDNEMWVPASELHAIPGLTEADLAHLHPEDAARYRETHPVAEHPPGDEADDRPRDPDSALRPPDDVGRGSGRVELHRTAAVRELVRGIEQRLDAWSRDNGRPRPGQRLLDLAHEAVGKLPNDRPVRVAKFDAINARLVHDVLGPTAAPRRFDAALSEMLNGGRSAYLEGETAFGKVEQLVVLRARLGPGEYHRTAASEVSTAEHETARRVTEHDQRGWTSSVKLGVSPFPGVTGKPASLALPGMFARFGSMTGSERIHEHRENVTTTREGPAVQFLHDLTVEMEVYPYARPGTYGRLLGTWAPALAPRRFGQPWREEFQLGPGAVRSAVARDEALVVDDDPTPPLDRADGSLRQQQVAERGEAGLSEHAQVRPRPIPASRLHDALRALAFGDSRGESPWPGLRPRAAHQLLVATSSGQLGSHLRREMSDSGYVVPLVGDRLEQVRISLDVHRRELLRVVDGGAIDRTTTRAEGGKPVSERGWEVGFANAVDFREMNVGDGPIRPDQLVSGFSRTAKEWTNRHEQEISTAHPEQFEQQRRYVVRLHPRWRITPTWRGKEVPESWPRTLEVDEDDPIVVEVDRTGLEDLGLRAPEEHDASRPGSGASGENADRQQEAASEGAAADDPLQDWLLYEEKLLGGSGPATSSGGSASAAEPPSLGEFLGGRSSGGTAPVDQTPRDPDDSRAPRGS